MLCPVNTDHMPVGEPGWGTGEEGEWGDPADAMEKGELTPVKWLIKVRWSPLWGANNGRETQNPLWQTEHCAGHKPQTGSTRLGRYFYWMLLHRRNTLRAWNTDDRCFYFPTQGTITQSLFYLTAGWQVERDLNFASTLYVPLIQCIQIQVWLLLPLCIDNWSALCEACCKHWSYWWFPCSQACKGSGRNRCDIQSPSLSHPPSLPLLLVKQSVFDS